MIIKGRENTAIGAVEVTNLVGALEAWRAWSGNPGGTSGEFYAFITKVSEQRESFLASVQVSFTHSGRIIRQRI